MPALARPRRKIVPHAEPPLHGSRRRRSVSVLLDCSGRERSCGGAEYVLKGLRRRCFPHCPRSCGNFSNRTCSILLRRQANLVLKRTAAPVSRSGGMYTRRFAVLWLQATTKSCWSTTTRPCCGCSASGWRRRATRSALPPTGKRRSTPSSRTAPTFSITDWEMPRVNGLELCRTDSRMLACRTMSTPSS